MNLPSEVLQMIVNKSCIEVKIVLYDSGLLNSMVTTHECYNNVVSEIQEHYYNIHRILYKRCLDCLIYHTYDDGTPMKNRQCHKYRRLK